MRLLPAILLLVSTLPTLSQPNNICITVDDLPANSTQRTIERHTYITTHLLAAFKNFSVPAIGFVNEGKLTVDGKKSVPHEDLLAQWTKQGLELGNHTYTHMEYNTHSPAEFENDIINGEKFTNTLFPSTPNRIKYFRHPFLHAGNTPEKKAALIAILKKLNYTEAPVTIDNSEWIFAHAYDLALDKKDDAMRKQIGEAYTPYMMEKIKYYESQSRDLFGRNIAHTLLIHANSLNSDYLPDLLKALQQAGYEFRSLTETLSDPAYSSPDNYVGNAGISWIHRWAITQGKGKEFFGDEPNIPAWVLKYSEIEGE